MKVERSRPVRNVAPTRSAQAVKTEDAAGSVSGLREPSDSAAVMGIPEAELTPKVRAAIMALMEEVNRLRREVAATHARLKELEELADMDPLLPVLNRRAFLRELSRIMSYAERYGSPASLIYIDLDNFKTINDRFGHAAGDEALKRVAELLMSHVRASDSVGRLGGDEFGVLLAHASVAAAQKKADNLVALLTATPVHWQGQTITLSASHGVHGLGAGDNPVEALARADQAMYAHKTQRKTSPA